MTERSDDPLAGDLDAAVAWAKEAGAVARVRAKNDRQVGYLQSRHDALNGMITALFARTIELRREVEMLKARPVAKYMGVWDRRREYEAGDQVTVAGSLWLAKSASQGCRPPNSPDLWRLIVKQGRA